MRATDADLDRLAIPGAGYKPTSLHAAADLARRFPARLAQAGWAETRRSRGQVLAMISAPPLMRESAPDQAFHYRGTRAVLARLSEFPGDTWQDRFLASTASAAGNAEWKDAAATWWSAACSSPVSERRAASLVATGLLALARTAVIQASKGGHLADITVGDALQLLQLVHRMGGKTTSGYFYQLLHTIGVFGAEAPTTVRAFATIGQLSAEQLIDRYQIACRPMRDLLVCYLRERQPAVDYATLQRLAGTLGRLFWADLERHHPGIDSLRLPADAAAEWKQRVLARESGLNTLATVRAFYLDIAQWAMEDPAQWGPWAAPCPIRGQEMSRRKVHQRRKSRMDQRTRDRLPALPTLLAAVGEQRITSAKLLATARDAPSGQEFTAAGHTLVRTRLADPAGAAKTWVDDPATGQRRDLTLQEHQGFWAWAAIEVLRHTGLRVEELCELSHHSFVQYTLPPAS